MKQDLLTLWDLEPQEILSLLEVAAQLKQNPDHSEPLKGKTLGLIFEKASTRTKVSFTVAAYQLGAQVITLEQQNSQLGRGESYADTAKVLSRYVDAIMIRTFGQASAEEMARHASIPVINGLSDMFHPCQLLADLLTVQENKGDLSQLKISWVGDGNNMTHSWMVAAAKLGFELCIATPASQEPDGDLMKQLSTVTDKIVLTQDPFAAVKGADVVNTDTWVSMGEEDDKEALEIYQPYQLNSELLKSAKDNAIVLHCLPAHRGHEITDEVMDGPQSKVWDQAENRLHAQKAVLLRLLGRK